MTANRRSFIRATSGLGSLALLPLPLLPLAQPQSPKKRMAGVITIYRKDSHADVILSKILSGWKHDGGPGPQLDLVSLYVDQFPEDDLSRELAKKHGFRLCPSIPEALTLDSDKLQVDGVICIGEHGDYPHNVIGQHLYPRRRFFEGILGTFEKAKQVVPVFHDKHPGPELADMLWMAEQSRKLKVPWMAGSSLPVGYRDPQVTLPWGDKLVSSVAVGYSGLDVYGFHTLDVMQSVLERRGSPNGGPPSERGVQWVQSLPLNKLSALIDDRTIDSEVLDAALKQSQTTRQAVLERSPEAGALFLVGYRDGWIAPVLMLDNDARAISMAYRKSDNQVEAFHAEERVEPRYPHFACLLKGIEQMMLSGKPAYPVERTLLSSGMLDRLLNSKAQNGARLSTPELAIEYTPVKYGFGDDVIPS